MKYLPLLPILSRYPFLRVAAKVFEGLNIEAELEKFPEAVELGKKIVLSAIEGKHAERKYVEGDLFCAGCEEVCINCRSLRSFDGCNLCLRCFENCKLRYGEETALKFYAAAKFAVLSYICARSIASQLEDWARMKFAVSEASYYASLLRNESDAVVRLVAADLGVKLRNWDVHVSSYVRASSRIRAAEWRLVNRTLRGGYVVTTRREVERIIEELLRQRLSEKVAAIVDAGDVARRISKREVKVELGSVDAECFPPCMKQIIAQLQRGENVPHTARFAVTSFLLNIGMSVDEIIELFKTAPDFDEEKTRYQVEHIAGERGKGVEYTSPSCDTMRTYQNCVADCGVPHPLIYYRNCKKQRMKRGRT